MNQEMLPGFDEFADVAAADSVSPEEAARISAEARAAFEALSGERVAWMDEYLALRAEGWPWRVSCYIAWACTPRQGRWPGTLAELASHLGLKSARAIRRWREKNEQIDARVAAGLFGPLLDARADVLSALVEVATGPEAKNHPDRRLYLEMTRLYTPRQEVDATVRRAGVFLPELAEPGGEGADG